MGSATCGRSRAPFLSDEQRALAGKRLVADDGLCDLFGRTLVAVVPGDRDDRADRVLRLWERQMDVSVVRPICARSGQGRQT